MAASPSSVVCSEASTGVVQDVAVDESGLWLAMATTTGVHLYMACEPSDRDASRTTMKVSPSEGDRGTTASPPQRQWTRMTVIAGDGRVLTASTCPSGGVQDNAVDGSGGVVLSVAWAPSVYYTAAVVTCSESGRVSLWRSVDAMGRFEEVYRAQLPAPAWRVEWAAQEYGRLFAVSAADGSITTFTGIDAVWVQQRIMPPSPPLTSPSPGDRIGGGVSGCTSLSFAPFLPSNELLNLPFNANKDTSTSLSPLLLVSCYRSHSIFVWIRQLSRAATGNGCLGPPPGTSTAAQQTPHAASSGEDGGHHPTGPSPAAADASDYSSSLTSSWSVIAELPLVLLHDDSPGAATLPGFPTLPCWREVAWAKNAGLPFHYVAAGSEEGYVGVWIHNDQEWRLVLADSSGCANAGTAALGGEGREGGGVAVTRLSWSEVGTFLLVSYADGQVVMWKETSTGGWKVVTELECNELDVA